LTDLITNAVDSLVARNELPEALREVAIEVSDTKSADHGDYACNLALAASKKAGLPPRVIGERLKAELETRSEFLNAIEIAGPGFLNFRLVPAAISSCVSPILSEGSEFGKIRVGGGQKMNVEFVSVNPNGPITIGSGRGAAFGDALCRVLAAAGYQPYREYYINDGVNSQQMKLFAESVKFYYLEFQGVETEFPENGYKGSYVADVAATVRTRFGDSQSDQPIGWFQTVSQELMLERQRQDLLTFRVDFDRWSSEQDLHNEGKVAHALEQLELRGNAYRATQAQTQGEPDGDEEEPTAVAGEALWLRSSAFGDDKDRVLVRADGRPAYIAADAAYMEDKFERGFPKLKLILGPDHHGYINRMYAACQAIGHTTGIDGDFEIIIYQVVRFVKEGKPARMRKRDGNIYELRDLIEELGADAAGNSDKEEQTRIGADVARFFFLMRSHETHMDFDIDLATKQSDENPVFYAQYAHARICSVIGKGEEAGLKADPNFDLSLLQHPKELELIKKILDLPFEVERSSRDYGVHRLTTFSVELGRNFHHFYDACRVVQPDEPELSQARLALCEATRIGLANTFELLGISAPTRMDRQREPLES
jgi:arginyl-tRNA synthetase